MMPSSDESWRTPNLRQSMVTKIEEAIMHCGAPTSKNAIEMESQVFAKAKSKDEYLSFVARLIIHIKEMGTKKLVSGPGMGNQQNPGQVLASYAVRNFPSIGVRNIHLMQPAAGIGNNGNCKVDVSLKCFGIGNQVAMGQMSGVGVQQNLGMMNQMNQMGNMGMMGQQGMVHMSNQNSMMQAAALQQQQQQQQQQQVNQQMGQQQGNPNQLMSQQNFMQQQAQMQNSQMQMQNSQLQNPQMSNVGVGVMQNQQMMNSAQLQNSQLQNQQQQLQNAQLQAQNQQLQNQQLQQQQQQNQQSAMQASQQQQMQNAQLQGQQNSVQQMQNMPNMQNVQMQNPQMQNQQQLQDHMRSQQMNMGNQSMSAMSQMSNVPMQNPQMGNVGGVGVGNPMGNPQMQGPGMQGTENQLRAAQMQGSQQMHNVNVSAGQMPNPGMQNMMASQQQQQPQPMMGSRTMGSRMIGPQSTMANQLSQMAKQQQNQQRGLHRAPNVDSVGMTNQYNGPAGSMLNRSVTPSQFMPSSAPPGAMVQTPSPGPPSQVQSQSYANSPAQSTLMPSPAAPGIGANSLRQFPNQMGVPSPGASINTPMMVTPTPSPRNRDDQACMEKIKELRRYTDLLQRMIAKIGNDDVEKSSKMKKLLEILTNPSQRVSMEILLKCEVALKKMEGQQNDPGASLGPIPQPPPLKDQSQVSPFQQIMDALTGALRTPSSSHTLLRTFRPTVEALTGHSFASSFQTFEDEEGSSDSETNENEIPSSLKRELRTLDSRFQVSIVRKGGGITRLSCNLNDFRLPRVPPLKIIVRTDYPFEPPVVVEMEKDYSSTTFLSSVSRAFKSRSFHLTRNHAVVEIIYMWEMCVRQASNPNLKSGEKQTPVTRGSVLFGC